MMQSQSWWCTDHLSQPKHSPSATDGVVTLSARCNDEREWKKRPAQNGHSGQREGVLTLEILIAKINLGQNNYNNKPFLHFGKNCISNKIDFNKIQRKMGQGYNKSWNCACFAKISVHLPRARSVSVGSHARVRHSTFLTEEWDAVGSHHLLLMLVYLVLSLQTLLVRMLIL